MITTTDFYKIDHISQYPEGSNKVYSNFTPRSARLFNGSSMYDNKIVNFGIQATIKDYLIDEFNRDFFNVSKNLAVSVYKRLMDFTIGDVRSDQIEALHDLGYLPLIIKALPEGSRSPIKVPSFTITSTKDEFFWLVNYFESSLSTESWKSTTMATTAFEFRRVFEHYAALTGAIKEFIPFQGHDFSMRGLGNRQEARKNSIAHLTSFVGTDTIPAIEGAEKFYNADIEQELVGTSVFASEHSTITMSIANYIKQNDMDLDKIEDRQIAEQHVLKHMITNVYPKGIYSHVSDSYDYWYFLNNTLRKLKDVIIAREVDHLGLAKLVCRPDSGDPESIICGLKIKKIDEELDAAAADDNIEELDLEQITHFANNTISTSYYDGFEYQGESFGFNGKKLQDAEIKGSLEILWDIFDGTITEKGFRILNPRIGLIYGDSITIVRQESILKRMMEMGFSSDNIVFGVGSYSYQYMTRDTLGFAMKATYGEVEQEGIEIFKDPKTDSGTKKSAKGLLHVTLDSNGDYMLVDQVNKITESNGELQVVFENGELKNETTLAEIRSRINSEFV